MKIIAFGFLVLMSIFVLPDKIEGYKLYRSNSLVQVTVKKLPDCSSGYRHKFLQIKFNDSTYSFRAKCKHLKALSVGKQFAMLHAPGSQQFYFKEEVVSEFIAVAVLIVFLMISLVFLIKKR